MNGKLKIETLNSFKFSRKVTWELIQIKLPSPKSALADSKDTQCPIKQIDFNNHLFGITQPVLQRK